MFGSINPRIDLACLILQPSWVLLYHPHDRLPTFAGVHLYSNNREVGSPLSQFDSLARLAAARLVTLDIYHILRKAKISITIVAAMEETEAVQFVRDQTNQSQPGGLVRSQSVGVGGCMT